MQVRRERETRMNKYQYGIWTDCKCFVAKSVGKKYFCTLSLDEIDKALSNGEALSSTSRKQYKMRILVTRKDPPHT